MDFFEDIYFAPPSLLKIRLTNYRIFLNSFNFLKSYDHYCYNHFIILLLSMLNFYNFYHYHYHYFIIGIIFNSIILMFFSSDINKFLWMVRIGGSTPEGAHIKVL